jgi:hypothetical protein
MTYDLAVWEGEQPDSDEAAAAMFRDLHKRYVDTDVSQPPTARLRHFVDVLLARWPDVGDEAGESSPWATGPLVNEAVGPLMYFAMVYGRAREVSDYVPSLAWAHGLVCFDPQLAQVRMPPFDWAADVDQLISAGQTGQANAKIREQLGCTLPEAVAICDQRATVIGDGNHRPARKAAYVLTTASGGTINNPSPDVLGRLLGGLSPDEWFAILERADGWYVQVGVGAQAGTRPGWYALERHDGDPSQHYQTVVTDLREVIAAFTGFAADDPGWTRRFAWEHYEL